MKNNFVSIITYDVAIQIAVFCLVTICSLLFHIFGLRYKKLPSVKKLMKKDILKYIIFCPIIMILFYSYNEINYIVHLLIGILIGIAYGGVILQFALYYNTINE